MTTIKDRYNKVQERIRDAAARSGRESSEIHLVAVTKYASVDDVRQLVDMGHTDFGESRLQHFTQISAQIEEYVDRRRELGKPDLAKPIRWHFIGHLQRNKCRRVIPITRMIHSVDTLRLAEEIQEVAGKKGVVIEVLLQTNISRERQKSGIAPAAVEYLLEQISTMPNVVARGMMCMAPASEDPEDSREVFMRCSELFSEMRLSKHCGEMFNVLSMGMSNDFEIAIECGANIVRVGSALFGEANGVCTASVAVEDKTGPPIEESPISKNL
ncbi:MAG: YggS family pyridoxal phosphate-dependent enzyme [Planctomycetes bacterium]|nr:YggS family pyridoxal phosphate-dependent enzyme [Planctomycetota bacterium]